MDNSTEKTEIAIFKGKTPFAVKFVCTATEKGSWFKYLAYYITYEKKQDFSKKIRNYYRTMWKTNQELKPSFVQMHVRIKVY